jgi:hypothetical protein
MLCPSVNGRFGPLAEVSGLPHVSDYSTELSYSLAPVRSQQGTLLAIKQYQGFAEPRRC